MVDQIKSKYILKKIICHICEENKLKLFKYNNKLKKIFHFNLINYKLFKQTYMIGNKNGYGKEYNNLNDELVFEGEYIDGKRCGYGKEYFENKIIYEGKYLNGKRNGKGKLFNHVGRVRFDGVYLFGNIWESNGFYYKIKEGKGYIKEFDFYNNLLYEGEYKNGYGKEYYIDRKLKFEGIYYNGLRWNGKGYDINNNIIYELKNGKGYIKEFDYKVI